MSRLEATWHFVAGFSAWANQQVTGLLIVLSQESHSRPIYMVSANLTFILSRFFHSFVLLGNWWLQCSHLFARAAPVWFEAVVKCECEDAGTWFDDSLSLALLPLPLLLLPLWLWDSVQCWLKKKIHGGSVPSFRRTAIHQALDWEVWEEIILFLGYENAG